MAAVRALRLYAGPAARRHLERQGLQPQDIRVIPAAAGGPKGLILGPLDRYLFGHWLPQSSQPVHLVGASIGAWRMATACLDQPIEAFERLERDYICQDYELPPGQRLPTPAHVSERFGQSLRGFYGGRLQQVLGHPRYHLHVVVGRGRRLLAKEHPLGTPLGYAAAFIANALHRPMLGQWMERVVFSTAQAALPFATDDFPTRQLALTEANFHDAVQASCSIPFAMRAMQDIAGAPQGTYWDGGITDYHLHLPYQGGLVLYPHFQKSVVPGWLDKGLRWRHAATARLDQMLLLAPDPQWVAQLPGGKLPDRTDFTRFAGDLNARVQAWTAAVQAARQLADEFDAWLAHPDPSRVEPL